jgi:hypothetical protein
MSIYHVTKEQQILQDKLLSELFETEPSTFPLEDYYCESIPWVDSETQSRPGNLNGMYGWKWGDNHPKGMLGKKHTEETKRKWSETRKGSIPWNLGIPSPEHSERMKAKMIGNSYAKGVKYPKCSCMICKKTITSNTLSRHISRHTSLHD